jgi:hypothetical protein
MGRLTVEQTEEINQNAESSLKRGGMKLVLGLNILLRHSLDIWQRRLGFEISDLLYF